MMTTQVRQLKVQPGVEEKPPVQTRGLTEDERLISEEARAAFGQLIRDLRKANRLTQEELAKRMDLNISYIRMLEAGQRVGSVKTHLLLGAILGVKPSVFIEMLSEGVEIPDLGRSIEEREIEEAVDLFKKVWKQSRAGTASSKEALEASFRRHLPEQQRRARELSRDQSRDREQSLDRDLSTP